MFHTDDDESIVRFLSVEEKIIRDFLDAKVEHVRAAGYVIRGAELYDNFGDKVDVRAHSDD
ncbi:MAG TPA: hypothetical protein VGK19_18125 [Capsulimonadaceae bacterium]|jgi:hypothetical protein